MSKETRTIEATIKGIAQEQGKKGPYASIEVQARGRPYPERFNCWDAEVVTRLSVGQQVWLVLQRGAVAQGREDDGKSESYWWRIKDVAQGPAQPPKDQGRADNTSPPAEAPETAPRGRGEASSGEPAMPGDAIQHRIEMGMAFNAAVALLAEAGPTMWAIRALRDELYYEVIRKPVAPEHYCYRHEAPRLQSAKTGVWGHMVGDEACTIEPLEPPEAPVVASQPKPQPTAPAPRKPIPGAKAGISPQGVSTLLNRANELGVPRPRVMDYIREEFGSTDPRLLTDDQFEDTRQWVEAQGMTVPEEAE